LEINNQMPSFYSPTYYEDRKKEHDFYIDLGNQCRIADEQRAALEKARMELQEEERQYQILQGYNRKLDEAKKVLEEGKKLSHALMEYSYTKDKELVLFSDRIAWRDSLSPEEEACYREWLSQDLGSTKIDVVNKIK
jgi:phage-related tail protein